MAMSPTNHAFWLPLALFVSLASCGGAASGQPGAADPRSNAAEEDPGPVILFSDEMTHPKVIAAKAPTYTEEAFETCTEGWAVSRCVITAGGAAVRCRITRSVPHMDRSILAALAKWRFAPALLAGKPVSVDYELKMWIAPPGSKPPASEVPPAAGASPAPAGSASGAPPAPEAPTAPAAIPEPTASIPFAEGKMVPPNLLCGRDRTLAAEAQAQNVEGLVVAQCMITREGRVKNCKIMQSLGAMDAPVLEALESRRYTPVLFKGQPVAVDYVFNIDLVAPRPGYTPDPLLKARPRTF